MYVWVHFKDERLGWRVGRCWDRAWQTPAACHFIQRMLRVSPERK